MGHHALTVFFDDDDDGLNEICEAHCTDALKSNELVGKIGIGRSIVLFNVMKQQEWPQIVIITERSGIRLVCADQSPCLDNMMMPEEETVKNPLPCPAQDWRTRWECIECGALTFISKLTCQRCNVTKREGPATFELTRKRWTSEEKWFCSKCGYDRNFQSNTWCWKCNADRKRRK